MNQEDPEVSLRIAKQHNNFEAKSRQAPLSQSISSMVGNLVCTPKISGLFVIKGSQYVNHHHSKDGKVTPRNKNV